MLDIAPKNDLMLIFLLGGKPSDPFTILTYWSNSYL